MAEAKQVEAFAALVADDVVAESVEAAVVTMAEAKQVEAFAALVVENVVAESVEAAAATTAEATMATVVVVADCMQR